jgi:putative ABC transport system permease protein
MDAMQLQLPDAATVLATRTIVVSMLVGTIVTLLATIVPALRATRVPPITAVSEGATLPPGRAGAAAPRLAVATVVLALTSLAAGALAPGLGTGGTLLAFGGGILALFVGVAMVAPRLVRPLTAVIGAPSSRFAGFAGRLATENAMRNPSRTASTAAALMIGLALVTVVATLGAGLRHSTTAALRDQVAADYVVTSGNGFAQFSKEATRALPQVPGVGVASAVLDDRAHVRGSDVQVEGVDPATIGKTFNFGWTRGSSDADLAALGTDGALVKQSYADKHHLRRGSVLNLTGPTGRKVAVRVRGVYDPPAFDKIGPVLGPITISQQAFAQTFPRGKVLYAFIKLQRDASPALVGQLRQQLQRFPDTKIQTRDAWAQEQSKGINTLLNLLYVLLALSIVVSLFGMVNTLVLAVFERTRELGMLRAVGMSRRQIRRTIRHESTITALIGAGLGLPVGLLLAGAVTRALSDQGLSFVIPAQGLVVLVTIAIGAGLLAAVVPARRASRLDVLTAVKYE